MLLEELQHPGLDDIFRLPESFIERSKGMSGHPELFRVPAESEIGGHGVLDEIADVLQIQCCQEPGLVVLPAAPEGPFQVRQLIEPGSVWKELIAAQTAGERGVAVLQEAHHQVHGIQIGALISDDPLRIRREPVSAF